MIAATTFKLPKIPSLFDVNPAISSTIVYTKTALQTWDLYDFLFGLELIQSQTATPSIIQDSSYYNSFFQFITNIWNAETANTYGNDLYSSQSALNRNQNLINNSDYFF